MNFSQLLSLHGDACLLLIVDKVLFSEVPAPRRWSDLSLQCMFQHSCILECRRVINSMVSFILPTGFRPIKLNCFIYDNKKKSDCLRCR